MPTCASTRLDTAENPFRKFSPVSGCACAHQQARNTYWRVSDLSETFRGYRSLGFDCIHGKMSSEIMAYSCSPWKTDLGSTLLPLSFLNDRCFLSMEISHIEVTFSYRWVALTGRRAWYDSSHLNFVSDLPAAIWSLSSRGSCFSNSMIRKWIINIV